MKDSWDDCGVDMQAKILVFDQTMQHDENERDAQLAGAGRPSGTSPNKAPTQPRPAKPARKKSNR